MNKFVWGFIIKSMKINTNSIKLDALNYYVVE